MQTELQKTERELKINNYSFKTSKSCLYGLRKYFSFKENNLAEFELDSIKNFLLQCQQKRISPQSRNLFLNAIKFYYRNVAKNIQKIDIRSAKEPKSLPAVLSRSEVKRVLESQKTLSTSFCFHLLTGQG